MIPNDVSLENFWYLVIRLKDDAHRCLEELDKTADADEVGKSFWSSMYARAVFAFIDGTVHGMLFQAYIGRNRRDVTFSSEEMTRLESYFDFDGDREAISISRRGEMLTDLRFAFVAFARAHTSNYVLPIGDRKWVLIKGIARIRMTLENALTRDQLEVYPENIDTLLYGMKWFVERIMDLLKSVEEALSEEATDDAHDNELIM